MPNSAKRSCLTACSQQYFSRQRISEWFIELSKVAIATATLVPYAQNVHGLEKIFVFFAYVPIGTPTRSVLTVASLAANTCVAVTTLDEFYTHLGKVFRGQTFWLELLRKKFPRAPRSMLEQAAADVTSNQQCFLTLPQFELDLQGLVLDQRSSIHERMMEKKEVFIATIWAQFKRQTRHRDLLRNQYIYRFILDGIKSEIEEEINETGALSVDLHFWEHLLKHFHDNRQHIFEKDQALSCLSHSKLNTAEIDHIQVEAEDSCQEYRQRALAVPDRGFYHEGALSHYLITHPTTLPIVQGYILEPATLKAILLGENNETSEKSKHYSCQFSINAIAFVLAVFSAIPLAVSAITSDSEWDTWLFALLSWVGNTIVHFYPFIIIMNNLPPDTTFCSAIKYLFRCKWICSLLYSEIRVLNLLKGFVGLLACAGLNPYVLVSFEVIQRDAVAKALHILPAGLQDFLSIVLSLCCLLPLFSLVFYFGYNLFDFSGFIKTWREMSNPPGSRCPISGQQFTILLLSLIFVPCAILSFGPSLEIVENSELVMDDYFLKGCLQGLSYFTTLFNARSVMLGVPLLEGIMSIIFCCNHQDNSMEACDRIIPGARRRLTQMAGARDRLTQIGESYGSHTFWSNGNTFAESKATPLMGLSEARRLAHA